MIDAAEVAAAALTVPGVVGLHPGPHGTASTFTAAGRIWGVRISQHDLDVHLVLDGAHHLPTIAAQLRAAVHALPHARRARVSVHAEDIVEPSSAASRSVTWTGAAHRHERDDHLLTPSSSESDLRSTP